MKTILVLSLAWTVGACSGGMYADPFQAQEWRWFESNADPALVDGAWTRVREIRHLDPAFTEEYVGADWLDGHARTLAELRPLLRPVTDGESAQAYLALLERVELKGGPDVAHIHASLPLRFEAEVPEHPYPLETYRPSDAARWDVPTEPRIRVTDTGVEIERVVWRPLWKGETEPPRTKGPQSLMTACVAGAVELVKDVVTRDGRVTREVLRVLETGSGARRHGPVPLM